MVTIDAVSRQLLGSHLLFIRAGGVRPRAEIIHDRATGRRIASRPKDVPTLVDGTRQACEHVAELMGRVPGKRSLVRSLPRPNERSPATGPSLWTATGPIVTLPPLVDPRPLSDHQGATMSDVSVRGRRHLTVSEVCAELGVARSTFYDWRAARKGPPCIKLPNGDLRIRRDEFERWLQSLEQPA